MCVLVYSLRVAISNISIQSQEKQNHKLAPFFGLVTVLALEMKRPAFEYTDTSTY